MKTWYTVALSMVAGAALGGAAIQGAAAQSAKDLVGTWTLVSADAFGSNPKGYLMFDANGRVSAVLMRSDLPKYASNNRNQGTAEENKATVQGTIAWFGTYSVSGTDLILQIEGSSFPNWNGSNQKRTNLSVSGDELRWTQPTPSMGGPPVTVLWKRAK
jgi:Lipocalin-like domain